MNLFPYLCNNRKPMSLHVVTVATHSQFYFPVYKASCERGGIDLTVLGWGKKWKGFLWKFNLVIDYLQTLPDSDIVIFTDAFDVFVLKDSETILRKFKSFNSPIVLSKDADSDNFIIHHFVKRIFPKCCDVYLNSGLYGGYVWALKQMFSILKKKLDFSDNSADDQRLLGTICSTPFYKENIVVDKDYILFYNVFSSNLIRPCNLDIKIRDGKIVNDLGIEPSFIHAPAKGNLNGVMKLYGYDTDVNVCNWFQLMYHRVLCYIKYVAIDVFLIAFILIMIIVIIRKHLL